MITDSGLGGLSVMAGLEQKLMALSPRPDLELLYVNATPDDRIGYNSLPDQQSRIALFDTFLQAVTTHLPVDRIIIACNTLSVLYHETTFSHGQTIPVTGIVDDGARLCREALAASPDDHLILFATETTVEADSYPRLIHAAPGRLVSQACPGLAHAISNDASGKACRERLSVLVPQALAQFRHKPEQVLAFLGCTHYGYQAAIFKEVLTNHGVSVAILNPNDQLVEQLMLQVPVPLGGKQDPEFRFISRYRIPEAEVHSMEAYLAEQAPRTLAALRNQEIMPDLFEPASE